MRNKGKRQITEGTRKGQEVRLKTKLESQESEILELTSPRGHSAGHFSSVSGTSLSEADELASSFEGGTKGPESISLVVEQGNKICWHVMVTGSI